MNFGCVAPTVASLQEVSGCKTSEIAVSARNTSNGKLRLDLWNQ